MNLNLIGHFSDAHEQYKDRLIAVFLHGSQNYDLDIDTSDVDSVAIILPSFDDICRGKSENRIFIRDNNEHISIRDIRIANNVLGSASPTQFEILFSVHFIVNTYHAYIDELIKMREDVARICPYSTVKAICGMANHDFRKLKEDPYESPLFPFPLEYNPKMLANICRYRYMLENYVADEPFEKCLRPSNSDFIKAIKRGYFNVEQAHTLAKEYMDAINKAADSHLNQYRKMGINEATVSKLDDLMRATMYDYLKSPACNY